jgi:predicted peptidase
MNQRPQTFEMDGTRLNYLLYTPPGYKADGKERWPLIYFLHGTGERGDDLDLLKTQGLPRYLETRDDFPFVVVSPQARSYDWWPKKVPEMNSFLDHVLAHHAIDTKRVYLSGLSMGGYGAWALAMTHPERFAALNPICGGGDSSMVCVLKNTPVWVFHGAKDNVVLIRESRRMVESLRECGGNVLFTVYPNAGHDSWTATYNNPKLYEWFLQQRLP